MSRRFAVLAAVGVLAMTAGAAAAKPPGGPQPADGPQPVDPPLASLCASYPHPLATCSAVAVSCPSTAKVQVACKTVASAGAANAPVQKLELQLPRAYVALKMLCQLKPGSAIACRITSRTRTSATGVRVMVLRLPTGSASARIACSTKSAKFACKIGN
jgi:hypothetical protein